MAGIKVQRYVAAFVDLLGQREALEKIELFPNTEDSENMARFGNAVLDSVGVVKDMHDTFSQYFATISAQSPTSSLSPEQKEVTIPAIKSQRFSDGLVFFCSLAEGVPASSVFGILAACGSSCLWQLAVKHPVRIGVDLHFGAESSECDLYGPVVANAYRLESEIAQYPRVVVGNEVVKYLKVCADQIACGKKEAFTKDLSGYCLEMLEQDSDGHWIVDYLGSGFKRYAAHKSNADGPLAAYKFAKEQAEAFKMAQNTKLAFRYSLLLNYIEHRLPLWGVSTDNN